ncbi:MAG: hypothetical protein ABI995_04900 [Acidobacteriota bacterium]
MQEQPVFLNEPDLRAANTDGDLDLVILYGCFHRDLSADEIAHGYTLMGGAFVENHAGYRINQILNETTDEVEKAHSWRVISHFEDYFAANPEPTWERGRALSAHRREDSSHDGFMMNLLFMRRRPILQLRDADQELLLAALGGSPDEEVATQLGKSLPTIKKRWLSLFERTLELKPELFPDAVQDVAIAKRGKQRRHHLLAYVRAHPEELRPVLPFGEC